MEKLEYEKKLQLEYMSLHTVAPSLKYTRLKKIWVRRVRLVVRKLDTMYKGNNYYERVEILTLCFVYSILLTTSQSIISPEKIKTSSITLFQFSFTEMLGQVLY